MTILEPLLTPLGLGLLRQAEALQTPLHLPNSWYCSVTSDVLLLKEMSIFKHAFIAMCPQSVDSIVYSVTTELLWQLCFQVSDSTLLSISNRKSTIVPCTAMILTCTTYNISSHLIKNYDTNNIFYITQPKKQTKKTLSMTTKTNVKFDLLFSCLRPFISSFLARKRPKLTASVTLYLITIHYGIQLL